MFISLKYIKAYKHTGNKNKIKRLCLMCLLLVPECM
jgi:hypothetical protein